MAVRIDITGQTFGGWQVIGSSQTIKRGTRYWDCKCLNCGKISAIAGGSLRGKLYSKNKYGCKECADKVKFIDLLGKQMCDWLVIGSGPMRKYGQRTWLCRCKCGTEKYVLAGMLLRAEKGFKGSSGCVDCQKNKKIKHKFQYLWNRCKSGALTRARTIAFTIIPQDIEDILIKQNYKCALSGELLYTNNKISTILQTSKTNISVDRINSDNGYTLDNIQLVTKQVNLGKQDYTQEEFIQMCNKVAKLHPR